jgi:hypothetical protein
MLQHLKQKIPPHRIKGLCDVQLQENTGLFASMEFLDEALGIQEVVVNSSFPDESALGSRHNSIQLWG